MKTVATSPEKLINDLVGSIKTLEAERDKLFAQRKDLKRFMDIDKEKAELAFLQSEKEKLIASASKEAEAIKDAARKTAFKMEENGNENARIIAEEARKIKTQLEETNATANEHKLSLEKRGTETRRIEAELVNREKKLHERESRIVDFIARTKEVIESL